MSLLSTRLLAAKAVKKCLIQPSSNIIRQSSHFTFVPESPDPSLGKLSSATLFHQLDIL